MTALVTLCLTMSQQHFRPPAVPLVTHDPYFSIWSFSDKLTDDWTKHWTGKNQAMCGMVRVDGMTYRWMSPGLRDVPAAEQLSLEVLPAQTSYRFKVGGVALDVDFFQPMQPLDLTRSAPSTRVLMKVVSTDGARHDVTIYFDMSAEAAVNSDDQSVTWSRFKIPNWQVLSFASKDQNVLGRAGDNLRIEWGRLYVGGPLNGDSVIGGSETVRRSYAEGHGLPEEDDLRQPRAVDDDWPVVAFSSHSLTVGAEPVTYGVAIAYDDDYSIEYFHRRLRASWRDEEFSLSTLFDTPVEYDRHALEDSRVLKDQWHKSWGSGFANLAVLAYRQALAAHGTARDLDGTLLMFPKENFSNGCISTVDVIYPACPIFLAYNPALLKANLEPVMQYASMPRWPWKFAPHDLGTYPKANGQVYGGGEKTEEDQMPVEESGNMLIMAAAYLEKSGDKAWVEKYWSKFTEWAQYLEKYGVDPGNQLCTDDFAGHLAHNANLSVKAIIAMACYGKMCGILGKDREKASWSEKSHGFAKEWMRLADDGDHYRLAFDKPGTWSQKYNLVWDKVLKLGLFPQEVYDKEVAWYLKHQNAYGLPLDNRATYTKLDWTVWTACLASKKEDFEAIMAPLYMWMNETPDRVPLTDWFDTKSAKSVGFRARSVVGGVFMPLLLRSTN